MKKHIFLFSFYFLFLIVFYSSILRAQIYSEAPITLSESGEILTDMIYVKFNLKNVVKIPIGDIITDGNSISENYPKIKKVFADYCKERNLNLYDLKLMKAIPKAKEEDTLYVDEYTGEIKILPNLANVFIVRFPKPVDVEKIIKRLRAFSVVEFTHGPVQWVNCDETPNDPKYTDGSQWYLNAIQAPQAWGITKGDPNIKIAIVDAEGVQQTHEDLLSKIVGGDGLGIIGSHGTWVAGFAGAATNNSLGIASLGWNISLLTYRPQNDSQLSGVAQKIIDATDDGTSIINLSFRTIKGGFSDCGIEQKSLRIRYYYRNWDFSLVREAIEYAIDHNVVVIASAGNAATPIGNDYPCEAVPYPVYPASYPGVISVSASMQDNNFFEGWNYGSHVDLNAPGSTDQTTGLWTTDPFNNYSQRMGTSFSAPIVSSLVALLKSINPSLTLSQIETIMESTADKIGEDEYDSNGWNQYMGYGRIDAYQALKYTLEHYGGTIAQDLTIPAGETWTFNAGITLKFQSGTSLIVNGVLNAQGTSGNLITFTGLNGGYWGGIQLNGSGTFGSVINYANIEKATEVDVINATYVTIQNCIITNSLQKALYFYDASECQALNNTISNSNIYHGISIEGSSTVDCINNTVTKTTPYTGRGVGIFYGGGTYGNVAHNDVSGWDWGIAQCWGGFIYSYIPSYPGINNRIRNNSVGVKIYRNSYAQLGLNNPYNDIYGGNSIYNNSLNVVVGSPYPEYPSGLYACHNWWGSENPNTSLFYIGPNAYFYYTPYLSSDPWSGLDKMPNYASLASVEKNEVLPELSQEPTGSSQDPLLAGINLLINKKYSEAKDLLISYISNHPDNQQAYVELYNCYNKETAKDIISFFSSLPSKASQDNKLFLAHLYLKQGDTNTATKVNNSIISENPNTSLSERAMINNAYIALYNENNVEKAANIFKEVLKHPELSTDMELQDVSDAILTYAKVLGKNSIDLPNLRKSETTTVAIPKDYELSNNYPNPFNPTTIIKYQLPKDGYVTMKVYDILGREVATLVNEYKTAGSYDITFNASNLASGVYIYQLRSGNFVANKKLLLMK